MSEMIERVAQALGVALGNKPWPDLRPDYRDGLRELARAAIEAMREPTGDMEIAGAETMGETEGFGAPQQSGLIYRGMIHAALTSEASGGEVP